MSKDTKKKAIKSTDKTKKDIKNSGGKNRKKQKNNPKNTVKNLRVDYIKLTTAKDIKRGILTIFFLIIFAVAGYFLFTLEYFNVKNVTVSGNVKYSPQEITDAAKVNVGKNIFLMWTNPNLRNLKTLPYIEGVKIRRVYPNTININVTERESKYLAYDKYKNIYYKLDKNGYILENSTINYMTDKEYLTYGITFGDGLTLGDKINEADISKLKTFDTIYSVYSNGSINMAITKLTFENSLTKLTLNDKIIVVLPNELNIKYNIKFLGEIIKNIGDKAGEIDMTKTNPTFSQFN